MAKKKTKVGSTGRFGARYGVKIRKQVKAIEKRKNTRYECPSCKHDSVKRRDTSIWECRHCGMVFAGGAYTPQPSHSAKLEALSEIPDRSEPEEEEV